MGREMATKDKATGKVQLKRRLGTVGRPWDKQTIRAKATQMVKVMTIKEMNRIKEIKGRVKVTQTTGATESKAKAMGTKIGIRSRETAGIRVKEKRKTRISSFVA